MRYTSGPVATAGQMLEESLLYHRWASMLEKRPAYSGLLHTFSLLRSVVSEHSKIIVRVFPEFTPHDSTKHLEHLFFLADKLLGSNLYERLTFADLSLLVFGLYTHDWGMAISETEREAIAGASAPGDAGLIPGERERFLQFKGKEQSVGRTEAQIWDDYLRETHAERAGCRLRKELKVVGQSFAENVARVVEGHTLDLREIRNPERYPVHVALLGEVCNVAAIATYVRLVDLFDIAEDRTPLALWSIIRPRNDKSRIEWSKHKALSPIALSSHGGLRQILIAGATDDPEVFAALADLRGWIDVQFSESIAFLRGMDSQYDPKLESSIHWQVEAVGFEPFLLRFDFDRPAALGLLTSEVYGNQRLTFIRELLQNSIDAIDTRAELLRGGDTPLLGSISVKISNSGNAIRLEWTDNGVGMDRYILEEFVTRIGRSWYQSADFKRHSFSQDPISKFGIGLLSCFAFSDSIELLTRRAPQLARDDHGWHILIPHRDGYFQVSKVARDQIGTTVILESPRARSHLTAEMIKAEVKRVAPLVRYPISLEVDGAVESIDPVNQSDEDRLPFIRLSSLDESAVSLLQSLTKQLNLSYRGPHGAYEAYFSCILPRDLASLKSIRYEVWEFLRDKIDFERFMIDLPTALFMKGVASKGATMHRSGRSLSALSINVLRPSIVKPNLARSHVDLASINLDELWDEVALRIRSEFEPSMNSLEARAVALYIAMQVSSLPNRGLKKLVPPGDWPVCALDPNSGFSWRKAGELLESQEVLEAPEDFEYRFGSGESIDWNSECFKLWRGPACILSIGQHVVADWWVPVTSLSRRLLVDAGFARTEIRFVTSFSGDDVPLALTVWSKHSTKPRISDTWDPMVELANWRIDPSMLCPELIAMALSESGGDLHRAPELFKFPPEMDDVAAIGSLYWNQNNPKIRRLVEVFLQLSLRFRRGLLSSRGQRVYSYLNSTAYLGYVVRSRHSWRRSAIDRFRGLLELADQEGLSTPAPLETTDFLPGSVGDYWNPYQFPFRRWNQSTEAIGRPWSYRKT